VRNNEDAVAIKELTRVTGIGPAMAQKLFLMGIKSLDDLSTNHLDKLNHHQKIGLKYVEDFENSAQRNARDGGLDSARN
jgi:DNA polymerase beta